MQKKAKTKQILVQSTEDEALQYYEFIRRVSNAFYCRSYSAEMLRYTMVFFAPFPQLGTASYQKPRMRGRGFNPLYYVLGKRITERRLHQKSPILAPSSGRLRPMDGSCPTLSEA